MPASPEPPRLVLDTNVLVSALLWTGPPNAILRAAEAGHVVLVASPSLVDEVRDVLGRAKLTPRLARLGVTVGELIESLLADVEIIAQPAVEPVITADPDDDHVLACALAGNARYVISGDRHLRDLVTYRGIDILTPAAMVPLLPGARESPPR